jgi:predicted nucleotidyltransferase
MIFLSKILSGSNLYGTNDALSDIDYNGIYLPTKEDILLSRVKRAIKYDTPGINETYFSLQFFISLACEGQTITLDMLHAPESMIVFASNIWKELVSLRHKFYSKNIHAFLEYAKKQAIKYSLKGDRRKDLSDVITLFIKSTSSDYKLLDVWNSFQRTKNIFEVEQTPQGIRQIFICGKIFQETQKVSYVLPVLKNLYNQYGERAKQAELNKGLDWQAISHAVRVLLEVKELLLYKTITFPLKETEFVKDIKTGKINFIKVVSPLLENLTEEIDRLLEVSKLPEKVDEIFWNNWLVNTLEKELFGGI